MRSTLDENLKRRNCFEKNSIPFEDNWRACFYRWYLLNDTFRWWADASDSRCACRIESVLLGLRTIDGWSRLTHCETLRGIWDSWTDWSLGVTSADAGDKVVTCCPGTVKCVEIGGVTGRREVTALLMFSNFDVWSNESSVEVDGRLVEECSVPQ